VLYTFDVRYDTDPNHKVCSKLSKSTVSPQLTNPTLLVRTPQPEMAIALTPFRGFCGFLPLPHLLLLLSTVPEMRSLIGEAALERLASTIHVGLPPKEGEEGRFAEIESLVRRTKSGEGEVKETNKDQKDALKEVFEILMTASEKKVQTTLRALITRYTQADSHAACQTTEERSLVDLVLQLNSQFPDDVGVLCSFILNVVELEVGKSVFLKADEPHAYISGGECEEVVLHCVWEWGLMGIAFALGMAGIRYY